MTSAASRRRILVGGYLGLLPAGGVAWDYLQYVLGFRDLGHDVHYVEDTGVWPVYRSDTAERPDCRANVDYLASVMERFGLEDRWAYRDEVTGEWFGQGSSRVRELVRTADVLVNVSCATPIRDEYRRVPVRAMVDSDPMFTQIQFHEGEGFTPGSGGMRAAVLAHTHHFTFGERIGAPGCRIPPTGVAWRPTRQPICLEEWPASPPPSGSALGFTTVMNWSAGRTLEWQGERWGQKDVEFEKLLGLPARFRALPLSAAIGQTGGTRFPADRIRGAGWQLLDPAREADSPAAYRAFIERSFGEFSVAKETYVKAGTGWFSCRSACYLASGRPVVTQDTGWSTNIPAGEGLFAFSDPEGAVRALEEVVADPVRHGRKARAIAEEYFDSRSVLARMLDDLERT